MTWQPILIILIVIIVLLITSGSPHQIPPITVYDPISTLYSGWSRSYALKSLKAGTFIKIGDTIQYYDGIELKSPSPFQIPFNASGNRQVIYHNMRGRIIRTEDDTVTIRTNDRVAIYQYNENGVSAVRYY